MATTVSKLTPEDAREMLDALGQSGDGWYRQVALAIKMNAHKALNMDRREFVGHIGIRMGRVPVERDKAILELAQEGMSQQAIADVLGVDHDGVADVVHGREFGASRSARDARASGKEIARPAGDEVIEGEATEVDEEIAKRDQEILDLRSRLSSIEQKMASAGGATAKLEKQIESLRKTKVELLRQLDDARNQKTDPEVIAKLEEQMRQANDQYLALFDVNHLISLLAEARDTVTVLIEKSLTEEHVRKIDPVFAALAHEYEIAKGTAVLNS